VHLHIIYCEIFIVTVANEEDKKEEERVDNTLENTLLGSGVGLVAIGGVFDENNECISEILIFKGNMFKVFINKKYIY